MKTNNKFIVFRGSVFPKDLRFYLATRGLGIVGSKVLTSPVAGYLHPSKSGVKV